MINTTPGWGSKRAMAWLLTSLLVVFTALAETGVGNSLREKRQGWSSASLALAYTSSKAIKT